MSKTVSLKTETELHIMECGVCGCVFGLSDTYYWERRDNGGTWHCPNGHPRVFRESDVERLTRLLAESETARESAEAAASRARAAQAEAARKTLCLEKRIGAGVCPWCHRTFRQLSRHVKCRHPEKIGR